MRLRGRGGGGNHGGDDLVAAEGHQRLQQPHVDGAPKDGGDLVGHLLLHRGLAGDALAHWALRQGEDTTGGLEGAGGDHQEVPHLSSHGDVEVEFCIGRSPHLSAPQGLLWICERVALVGILQLIIEDLHLARQPEPAPEAETLVLLRARMPNGILEETPCPCRDGDVCLATRLAQEHVPEDDLCPHTLVNGHADSHQRALHKEDHLVGFVFRSGAAEVEVHRRVEQDGDILRGGHRRKLHADGGIGLRRSVRAQKPHLQVLQLRHDVPTLEGLGCLDDSLAVGVHVGTVHRALPEVVRERRRPQRVVDVKAKLDVVIPFHGLGLHDVNGDRGCIAHYLRGGKWCEGGHRDVCRCIDPAETTALPQRVQKIKVRGRDDLNLIPHLQGGRSPQAQREGRQPRASISNLLGGISRVRVGVVPQVHDLVQAEAFNVGAVQ
mmetsp:Transcript_31260/g.74564  ORF Transcript_31260/g.74564 Transcript_31260/m.74564 type:complete len:437 (-) Transcript_31260:6952-8262(-)